MDGEVGRAVSQASTRRLWRITNEPRPYAWGIPGGIGAVFGATSTSGDPEAELWLGSHPGSPARFDDLDAPWPDLAGWESLQPNPLPFLVKVLAVGGSLSIQSHPSRAQAEVGFARETASGIPIDAPNRSYRDPNAKPELLVAVEDGFEALCGFREPATVLADLDRLLGHHPDPGLEPLRHRVSESGLAATTRWLLGGGSEVGAVVATLSRRARGRTAPAVVDRVAREYPADPGVAVALLLNHVVLPRGGALFLDAGTVHAYLGGVGVEVMGPSDNVVRGGLTPKYVDVDELLAISTFEPTRPVLLAPDTLGPHLRSYRPRCASGSVGFELLEATGPGLVRLGSASVMVVLEGDFAVADANQRMRLTRGESALYAEPGQLRIDGSGRMFVATAELDATWGDQPRL